MTATIFERVTTALNTLSPKVPFALGIYVPATGSDLPDQFIVFTLVSSVSSQSADDAETERFERVQVTIYNRSGLINLPSVDVVMRAAGFRLSTERQMLFEETTKHFGIEKEFTILRS